VAPRPRTQTKGVGKRGSAALTPAKGKGKGSGKAWGPTPPRTPPPSHLLMSAMTSGDHREGSNYLDFEQRTYESASERGRREQQRPGTRRPTAEAHDRADSYRSAQSNWHQENEWSAADSSTPVEPPWWPSESRNDSWGTAEWPATSPAGHLVRSSEGQTTYTRGRDSRESTRPARLRPATEPREPTVVVGLGPLDSDSDSIERSHLVMRRDRELESESAGTRRQPVPMVFPADFRGSQRRMLEMLRSQLVAYFVYTHNLFKVKRCRMCHEVKMVNSTILPDGRQGLADWPEGAVVNCCVQCAAADTRIENNPYQGISQVQAVHLLRDAVEKDRYKKITIGIGKEVHSRV
jgi:hypothetical protein